DFKGITKEAPRYRYGSDYNATAADFTKASATLSNKSAAVNMLAGMMYGDRWLDDKFGMVIAGSFQNMNKGNNSLFYTDVMNQTENSVRLS
ncbi:MAG TPA: hypothetical protein DCF91_04095, partial [Porphyromonadaceae bacterium]|nr:hypothetical protein [Porphyromonadaceae bacterium]